MHGFTKRVLFEFLNQAAKGVENRLVLSSFPNEMFLLGN